LGVIEPDVRLAEYWGLYKGGYAIGNSTPQTAGVNALGGASATRCGPNFSLDLGTPVEGRNNSYGLACNAYQNRPMLSGDTLTVRRVATAPTTVLPATVGPLRICSNRVSATIVNVAPPVNCPTAPAGAGQVADLIVNTYYIARDSEGVNNTVRPNVPALRVLSLNGPSVAPDFLDTEVVSGVEDLQVQFGIDTSGVTCTATQYIDAAPAAALPQPGFGQVVAVRIWLLVRADQPEVGFVDNTTYQYGDRSVANGTTNNLNSAAARTLAYQPNDGFRRLLVSRTIMLRNAVGC
jgi:type IV pilus assembly protein PilW